MLPFWSGTAKPVNPHGKPGTPVKKEPGGKLAMRSRGHARYRIAIVDDVKKDLLTLGE